MKIIAIDTSHNASLQKAKAFLKHHPDADKIFTFDYLLCEYTTTTDLFSDLEELPEEFFTKPCAYYDMVVSVLGRVRKSYADSIIIYSPQIDECSRLSSEYLYDNNILHFNTYHPGILNINYSDWIYTPSAPISTIKTPISYFFQRLIQRYTFGFDEDDYYSIG